MDVNHEGKRGPVPRPRIRTGGTLMQIVPPRFCQFLKVQAPFVCITMQQKAYQPHDSDTVFTISPKSTSSTSTKSPFQAEIQHFSGADVDKNTARNSQQHDISSAKIQFFCRRGLPPWGGVPLPIAPPLAPPPSLPDLHLRPPRIPVRFTPPPVFRACLKIYHFSLFFPAL